MPPNRPHTPPFLTDTERQFFAETKRWRWVTTLLAPDAEPPVAHPAHERWIAREKHIHRPAMREVMFGLRGESVFGLHGRVYRLAPGTVFLFDRDEARDWTPAPHQKGYTTLWLHFDRATSFRFNSFALDAGQRVIREISPRIKDGEAARQIIEAWERCSVTPWDALSWALLKAALTLALLEILTTLRREPPPRNPHREVILAVQEYIRSHPGADLGLEPLARIAGYSPFFVHRLFVQQTGQTPKSYVNEVRLRRAQELLREGLSLEAIAEQIGLRHASHFSRFFKQQTGLSPGAWRMPSTARAIQGTSERARGRLR